MGKTAAEKVFAKSVVAASVPIASEPNPQLEKVRILLAEDNIINQESRFGPITKSPL